MIPTLRFKCKEAHFRSVLRTHTATYTTLANAYGCQITCYF